MSRSGEPLERPIRPARPDDLPAIVALVEDAYEPYVARLGRKPGPMLDDYAARIASGEAWVVIDGGAIVGLVVVIEAAGRVLRDNVAVAPHLHGQGLGRRLVAFAEALAARRGHAALELYTHVLMTENVALYGRLGFVETARVREKGFDRVYMTKRLESAA